MVTARPYIPPEDEPTPEGGVTAVPDYTPPPEPEPEPGVTITAPPDWATGTPEPEPTPSGGVTATPDFTPEPEITPDTKITLTTDPTFVTKLPEVGLSAPKTPAEADAPKPKDTPPVFNVNALANATGLKPSQILKSDGSLNNLTLADKLGGKPSDYETAADIYAALRDKKKWGEDLLKEIFTFGQATTPTFNTDDLVTEYQNLEYEAAQDGLTLNETQDQFVDRVLRSQPALGQTIANFAIGATPIVGTVAYWNQMGTGGRALSVGLDILTFLPFAGIVAAGTRAGKSAGRAVMQGAVAEIKAPLTMITRPIQTLKTAWGTVETAVFPKTIPISAVEASFHTVKIPVASVGKKELAMQLRDNIMYNASRGQRTAATVKGVTAVVAEKSAARLKPAIWTGTPDVRPFLEGGVVGVIPDAFKNIPAIAKGKGRPMFVSNSLHTRFSLATSGGVEATRGAKPGALLIRDTAVLKKMTPSGKVYQGTAEIEALLKQGVELPKPSQTLYMRLPSGDKMTILVIGKPVTKAELAHLKLMGHASLIRDILRPATKASIKKAGGAFDELVSLKGKARAARVKARANPKNPALKKAADVAEDRARRFAKTLETNPGLMSYAEVIGTYSRVKSVYKPVGRRRVGKTRRVSPDGRRYVPTDTRIVVTDRRKPPSDERTPPDARRTPPADERTPPDDRRTPPPDERTPPPDRPRPPEEGTLVATVRIPPTQKKTGVVRIPLGGGKAENIQEFVKGKGVMAWRQGRVGGMDKWIIVRQPYNSKNDAMIFLGNSPPPGVKKVMSGEKSAYKSIQQITGKAPGYLTLDEGAMDIVIVSGKLAYRPDPQQRTKSRIDLGRVKVVKQRLSRMRGVRAGLSGRRGK